MTINNKITAFLYTWFSNYNRYLDSEFIFPSHGMKAFQNFYFTWYTFDQHTLKASFFYSFDHEIDFTETIDFSCPDLTPISTLDPEIINTLLFHMSLAIGISYYKLYPTHDLIVEHGSLNEEQKIFRKTFYTHGLWEFFFRNNISPKTHIQFVNTGSHSPQKIFSPHSDIAMIALWWGKDSIVSTEFVKKMNIPFYTATFGKDYYLHQVVNDKIWAPRLLVTRNIDPKLFEMNQQWYYNGHVPISGIIAFVLVTGAYLYDYRFIIMSNEKSANEGNTIMDGIEINHQRSKSYQFESDFSDYIHKYISPNVSYFSLLRWMYEIQIAQKFSSYTQYFDIFSSCNNNFRIIEQNKTTDHRRCGTCPKCAFVYTTLRPFISDNETQKIFGQELYENTSLINLYKELLGIDGIKPFECVGTNEEVTYAMYLQYKKIKNNSQIPPIMELFKNKILPTLTPERIDYLQKKLFTLYRQETHIPKIFQIPLDKEHISFI